MSEIEFIFVYISGVAIGYVIGQYVKK